MKKLICIISFFIFFSCVTEKQRLTICNNCAVQTASKDSLIIKLRDTTIYISQEGPIVYTPSPCDSVGNLKPINKVEKKNGITTKIKTIGNLLIVECDIDSLKQVIIGLREIASYHRKESSFIKYIPCKNEKTRFDGFTFWFFWITMPVMVVYLFLKFGWKYIKMYMHFK